MKRHSQNRWLCGLLGALLVHGSLQASEHGGGGASAAPAAADAAPSNAELRERYRKRMEEINKAKGEQAEKGKAPEITQEDLKRLHDLLKEREKNLEEMKARLEAKEKDLSEKETLLAQQVVKYQAKLNEVQKEKKKDPDASDEKLESFRQVYEKMEPKKAARIFEDLDPEMTSRVLKGMKQQQAAEILSKMDPEKARRITKRFLSSSK